MRSVLIRSRQIFVSPTIPGLPGAAGHRLPSRIES